MYYVIRTYIGAVCMYTRLKLLKVNTAMWFNK